MDFTVGPPAASRRGVALAGGTKAGGGTTPGAGLGAGPSCCRGPERVPLSLALRSATRATAISGAATGDTPAKESCVGCGAAPSPSVGAP